MSFATLRSKDIFTDRLKSQYSYGSYSDLTEHLSFGQSGKMSFDAQAKGFYLRDVTNDENVDLYSKSNFLSANDPIQDNQATHKKYVDSRINLSKVDVIDSLNSEVSKLEISVSQEVVRAQAKEDEMDSALNVERLRISSVDSSLSASIASESSRAQAKEAELRGELLDETKRASAGENILDKRISDEKSTREVSDSIIKSDLTKELNRAQAKESELTASILSVGSKLAQDVVSVNASISSEASRAQTAETQLFDKLSEEVTRAAVSENALDARLTNEVSRAKRVESDVKNLVEQEVLERKSSVSQEVLERNAAISRAINDVVGQAPEAFNTLKEIGDALTEGSDASSAILSQLNSLGSTHFNLISLNSQTIENESNRAELMESSLQEGISGENERAKLVEASLHLKVDGEIERATAQDGIHSSKIESESSRAKSEEIRILSSVQSEKERSLLAESNIVKLLNEETSRAQNSEDHNLQAVSNLDASTLSRFNVSMASISSLSSHVDDEDKRIEASVVGYVTRFNAELQAAAVAQAAKFGALDSEDTSIKSNVASEIDRSKARDDSLDAKLLEEILRAQNSELSNLVKLNSNFSSLSSLHDSLAQSLKDEENRAKSSERSNTNGLTVVSASLNGIETSLKSKISREESRAKNAESQLQSSLDSEIDGVKSSIVREKTDRANAIKASIDELLGGAPGALDTFNELALALQSEGDALAALTVTISKVESDLVASDTAHFNKSGGVISGDVSVATKFSSPVVRADMVFLNSNWRVVQKGDSGRILRFEYSAVDNSSNPKDYSKGIEFDADDMEL